MRTSKSLSMIAAALLALPAILSNAHPEAGAVTTYLGNEGILVSDGETRVLFDPLYPNDYGTYQLVPESIRQDLMAGVAPYADIQAIFISHMHSDHFSVDEIITYMQRHAQVQLYAPAQAVAMMREKTPDDAIFERITSVSLERLDKPEQFSEGALQIDVVRIPHAGWPQRAEISNLVWRVTLGDGVTVMHLGDAAPQDEHFAPHAKHWTATRTDTAYPPYWFYLSPQGREIVAERLNADKSTGVHVPVKLPPDLEQTEADFFHRPGETRALNKAAAH